MRTVVPSVLACEQLQQKAQLLHLLRAEFAAAAGALDVGHHGGAEWALGQVWLLLSEASGGQAARVQRVQLWDDDLPRPCCPAAARSRCTGGPELASAR